MRSTNFVKNRPKRLARHREGDFKLQCVAICHLFKFYVYFRIRIHRVIIKGNHLHLTFYYYYYYYYYHSCASESYIRSFNRRATMSVVVVL